jgi:hypothetical protein
LASPLLRHSRGGVLTPLRAISWIWGRYLEMTFAVARTTSHTSRSIAIITLDLTAGQKAAVRDSAGSVTFRAFLVPFTIAGAALHDS